MAGKIRKKSYIVFTAAAVAVMTLPFVLMPWHAEAGTVGNETETAFPSLRLEDGSLNADFLSEAGNYFEKHFAFRPQLLSMDSWIRGHIFGVSGQDSVIQGQHGWLYYAATLDDFQHNHEVSDRTLFCEAHNVALFQEAAESRGISFVFAPVPNKNTLYGENMPEREKVTVEDKSDMERLVPFLEQEEVNYVNMEALFQDAESTEPLYYERDSHWNETGAVLAYNALLDAVGTPHETYERAVPERQEYYGDLSKMLYPDSGFAEPETKLIYLENPTWSYANEAQSAEENRIETENPEGSGTLLMYRDSFGNSLLPYMAQTFRKGTFSKIEPIDGSDLDAVSPDVLIFEKAERHLPSLASVPAMIPGPVRDNIREETEITEADGAALCSQGQMNGYLTVSGTLKEAYVSTSTRVFVEITDEDSTDTYEAYTTADGNSDAGYLLYLEPDQIQGDIGGIRVFAVDGDTYTLVYEEIPADSAGERKPSTQELQEEAAEEETVPEEAAEESAAEAVTEGVREASTESDTEDSPEAVTEETQVSSSESTEKAGEEPKKPEAAETESTVKQEPEADSSQAEQAAAQQAAAEKAAQEQAAAEKAAQEQAAAEQAAAEKEAQEQAAAEQAAQEQAAAEKAAQEQAAAEQAAAEKAAQEQAAAEQAAQTPQEVSRVYVEDCGQDTGYWDITYSDGHHEYVDAQ